MKAVLQHPAVLIWLTITVYLLINRIRARTGHILANPVLMGTLAMMAYLKAAGIEYHDYKQASVFIDFWLQPMVVSLALPLYQNRQKIIKQWFPIIFSQLAGSLTGILSVVWTAKLMGADRQVLVSLAAKSVTNPVAIEITKAVGGLPGITAASVIVAGISGQMIGYRFMKAGRLDNPVSKGIAVGTSSHAMGVAASMERGSKHAAYAGLGLIFNGILTAVLVPLILPHIL